MHKSIVLCDDISSDYLQKIETFLEEWKSESATIVAFTSGSTGEPKQILLNKKNVRASAKATGEFFKFSQGQTLLLNLSPDYIAGKLMLVRALEHEMRIVVAPASQNPLLSIGTEKIDFAAFVPYQVDAILSDNKTRAKYESIPAVIIGGAPVSAKVESELMGLKNQSYATFGMTETITHIALRNISRADEFYTCLPRITVEQDERDCLVINENEISDRLVTNDLVTVIDSNKFQWHGRIDNVVNSAGIKLFPEKIEKKIADLMTNNRFYLIGQKSQVFGEELVLYVEGEQPPNWNQTIIEINGRLTAYERPKKIVFVSEFKETASGKVKRLTL
jgi:O-succinylbenzoic acid--CoA ligase